MRINIGSEPDSESSAEVALYDICGTSIFGSFNTKCDCLEGPEDAGPMATLA